MPEPRSTRVSSAAWSAARRRGPRPHLRPPPERARRRPGRVRPGDRAAPGPGGAKEWTHAAYSPRTELFYVPVQDVGATITRRRQEFREGNPYWGASVAVDTTDMAGYVTAIDAHGREHWRWHNEVPMCASVLATAGDLVFTGEPTGEFDAFDARTGELLWQFQTGSGIHSSPTTYSVDGRQYVAVPSGWGSWADGFLPGLIGGSHGDALVVFALPPD